MKTIYKRFIVGVLSLITILSFGFVLNASQTSKTALATTNYDSTLNYDFDMVNGASIRTKLETKIGLIKNAIRFSTYLSKSDLETARNSGDVAVYTLIAKYDELKKQIPDVEESNFADYMTLEYFTDNQVPCAMIAFTGERLTPTNDCEKGNNYYQYNACIYNLTDEELTTEFVARSCLVVNGNTENAQYTEIAVKRSIFNVAAEFVARKDEGDTVAGDVYNANPELFDYLSTKFPVTINSEFADTVTIDVPRGQKLSDFAEEYKEISTDKEALAYYNGLLEGETAFDVEKAITGEKRDITLTADYDSLTFETITEGVSVALTGAESKFYSRNREYIDEEQTAFESVVKVPSKYKGMDVVAVKENAFKDAYFLTTVILPDSVTQLGTGVFYACANLTTVVMPGVTTFANISDTTTTVANTFTYSNRLAILVVNPDLNLPRSMAQPRTDGKEPCPPVGIALCIAGETDNVSITSDKNGMINGVRYLYNKDGACGTWQYNSNGIPFVAAEEHNYNDTCKCSACGNIRDEAHDYEDGICTICNGYQSKGLAYELVTLGTETGYAVKIGDCKDTEIYVPKTYEGINVIAVNNQFASGNGTITKIVLPKEVKYLIGAALGNMSKLQTVIMPGVVDICHTDYNFTSGNARNTFYRDTNLRVLVINQSLNLNRSKTFYTDRYNASGAVLDIYVYNPDNPNQVSAVTLPTANAQLLSGKQYLYSETEKCGFWTNLYNPTYKAHTYTDANDYVCDVCDAIKEHTHADNLEDPTGKCMYCGEVLSEGLKYDAIYDGEIIVGYEVSKGDCTDKTIYVLSEYNGKPVTTVAENGFKSTTATKIVLPRSVVNVKYAAFASSTVQTVIMPGVINFIDGTGTYTGARNTFYNCNALKNIVVNSEINVGRQTFHSTSSTNTEGITIFIDGDTDSTTINATNNGMLNTTVKYLKSEWQYNSDGIPTPVSEE